MYRLKEQVVQTAMNYINQNGMFQTVFQSKFKALNIYSFNQCRFMCMLMSTFLHNYRKIEACFTAVSRLNGHWEALKAFKSHLKEIDIRESD